MKRSTERILTTHTGSLPRPDDLLAALGAENTQASSGVLARAVKDIVRKQVEVGVDIVNDGEMGKPSYATYVKDRLSGFEGSEKSTPLRSNDLAEFRNFARRG